MDNGLHSLPTMSSRGAFYFVAAYCGWLADSEDWFYNCRIVKSLHCEACRNTENIISFSASVPKCQILYRRFASFGDTSLPKGLRSSTLPRPRAIYHSGKKMQRVVGLVVTCFIVVFPRLGA